MTAVTPLYRYLSTTSLIWQDPIQVPQHHLPNMAGTGSRSPFARRSRYVAHYTWRWTMTPPSCQEAVSRSASALESCS